MRFETLAFAAIAATASADATSDLAACGTWKYTTYANHVYTDEWTLTNTAENKQIYRDINGNEITDWTSYTGYDTSKCAEVDGAAYLATGAALAALAATLAF